MDINKFIKMHSQFPYGRRPKSYQQYEVDGNIIRGDRDCEKRWTQIHMPADLSGKNILDLGCQIGFFCIKSKQCGAHVAVGIDINEHYIRCADMIAHCKRIDVKFVRCDINDPDGTINEIKQLGVEIFDYVLCLSIIKHVDPKCLAKLINGLSYKCLIWEGHKDKFKHKKDLLMFVKKHGIKNSSVEFIGYTDDLGKRAVWRMYR